MVVKYKHHLPLGIFLKGDFNVLILYFKSEFVKENRVCVCVRARFSECMPYKLMFCTGSGGHWMELKLQMVMRHLTCAW